MARDREHILVWLVQAKFRLLQGKNYFVMLKLNVTKMCQITKMINYQLLNFVYVLWVPHLHKY